ncbi:MAG: hypothetical protein Q8J85_07070 [Sulfuricurvum sp.]|nr:hypothetical protein [Sulfuricurvum sp.]MDP3023013.1 hypothetical protein [Sulfuricurvum sp.]
MNKLLLSIITITTTLFGDITRHDIEVNSKKYQNQLINKDKVSYSRFRELTTKYTSEQITGFQEEIARDMNIPIPVHKSIIGVENGSKYPYVMNCNNNIQPYSKDIMKNYMNYVNCSKNVDMGYSQVNYMIWNKRLNFTQEDLLDPKKNLEISMKILKMNYSGNWIRAIGHYHSYTPIHFNRYVKLAVIHLRHELKKS